MNINKIIKYITVNILLLAIMCLCYYFQIRICLTYNIFKIPCPGCGLTRSINYLINGNILMSLKYNIITIPLIIGYTLYSIYYIKDIIKNQNTLAKLIDKNKTIIIIICVIIVIISEFKNLHNPLLYK